MFVAPQSSSDKWYGLGFKSELLRPLHATYRDNCVITSIEKQKQRLGKPGKWVRLSMATGTKIKFFLNM